MSALQASRPLVSVVIPMFNAEKYVEEAVRSVLTQTFTDFEIIIVDDGSVDGSPAIIDRLAAEDVRIRVEHLPKNVGNANANNHGFGLARGTYIACMDADDICHPERLEKQVAYMDAHPEMGLVGTQYWRLSPESKVLRKTRNKLENAVIQFYLFFGVPFCNPSTFFRREILDEMLPQVYDPALKAAADYDFILRVGKRWKMHVLPEYLFYYRINPNGLSKTKKTLLVEETVARATPWIRQSLPNVALTDEEIATFIGVQLDNRQALTSEKLNVYRKVLHALCDAHGATVTAAERGKVRRFALELEFKTLVGRYKIYKTPALALAWLVGFGRRLFA